MYPEKNGKNIENVIKSFWIKIQKDLVEEVGQLAYKSWLSKLTLMKLENKVKFLLIG